MPQPIDISGAYAVYSAKDAVGTGKVATIRRQVENNHADTYDLASQTGGLAPGATLTRVSYTVPPPASPAGVRYVLRSAGFGNAAVSVVGSSVHIAWPGSGGANGTVWVRLM